MQSNTIAYTLIEHTGLSIPILNTSAFFGSKNMDSRGMKSSCIIIECRVELICGNSVITSCNVGNFISGGDKEMQQRFFSRTLVLIRGDFHREAVTDSASVPPNENPVIT